MESRVPIRSAAFSRRGLVTGKYDAQSIRHLTSLGGLSVPELRGIEMPQLLRIKIPEPEAELVSKVQRYLEELARYARTFTAAAEMLSFAHQKTSAHEQQHKGDTSALGVERHNLLAEWQAIAVREGAMTLFHYADVMNSINGSLRDCPTLGGSIDQQQLSGIGERFKLSFPGFTALAIAGDPRPVPSPLSRVPQQISFSQTYSADHVRIHGEKNNIFHIGDGRKFVAHAPGGGDFISYSLDSKAVYELREITMAYASIFSDLAEKLTPKWAPEIG